MKRGKGVLGYVVYLLTADAYAESSFRKYTTYPRLKSR